MFFMSDRQQQVLRKEHVMVRAAREHGFVTFSGCENEFGLNWACKVFWQQYADFRYDAPLHLFDADHGVCTVPSMENVL